MGAGEVLLIGLGVLAAVVVGVLAIVFLIVPLFKAVAWVFRQVFRFLVGEIGDLFRLLGAVILTILYVPVILLNLVIGRWSASAHYGRAIMHEITTTGLCLYRMAIGHPLRLFKAEGLVEGLEQRLPVVMANAPTSDTPAGGRSGRFDGYKIVGSLAAGGSGAKLYIALPDAGKKALLARQGFGDPGQVVIKVFSMKDGSSLPQIVRESRSLDAAKRLGLILDHELTPERFFYVMRFVPGEPLSMMTKTLHAGSPAGGLGDPQLRSALGYVSDLVSTLATYHRGGLWHKDVKPDNLIVDTQGRAHLVDFGLVTSLRSAMTLTTHGTEYFRDPEMVRQALRGVKVHEVDGTRFDIYGAGAVLYAVVEDGFPAHGVLSQVTKRCPESVKWIMRRAMADYDKRYVSAEAMLADLQTVVQAPDPFAVRPADLPSMMGGFAPIAGDDEGAAPITPTPPGPAIAAAVPPPIAAVAHAAAAAAAAAAAPPPRRSAPAIKVTNWWSGRAECNGSPAAGVSNAQQIADAAKSFADHSVRLANQAMAGAGFAYAGAPDAAARRSPAPPGRRSAREQVESARARVQSTRAKSRTRLAACASGNGINGGVVLAVLVLLAALSGGGVRWLKKSADGAAEHADAAIESVIGHAAGAGRHAAPIPPAQGTVLFISDVLQPWSQTTESYLQTLADHLRSAGLTLRGNVPGEEGEVVPLTPEDKDLIAAARLAMAATPPGDASAYDRLAEFLAAHAESAQVVLWVSPDPDQSVQRPSVAVIRHVDHNSSDGIGDTLKAALRRTSAEVKEPQRQTRAGK